MSLQCLRRYLFTAQITHQLSFLKTAKVNKSSGLSHLIQGLSRSVRNMLEDIVVLSPQQQ